MDAPATNPTTYCIPLAKIMPQIARMAEELVGIQHEMAARTLPQHLDTDARILREVVHAWAPRIEALHSLLGPLVSQQDVHLSTQDLLLLSKGIEAHKALVKPRSPAA